MANERRQHDHHPGLHTATSARAFAAAALSAATAAMLQHPRHQRQRGRTGVPGLSANDVHEDAKHNVAKDERQGSENLRGGDDQR